MYSVWYNQSSSWDTKEMKDLGNSSIAINCNSCCDSIPMIDDTKEPGNLCLLGITRKFLPTVEVTVGEGGSRDWQGLT